MKVCINLLQENKNTGPVIFAKRLATELEKQKVKIVDRSQKHDILLAIIRDFDIEDSRRKGVKIVQRLDGVYHYLEQDYQRMNRSIRDTFEQTDSVIYQSRFSKRSVKSFFGEGKGLDFVIPNGVDPKEFPKSKTNGAKKIFLTSSKWRSMKRLEDTIRGFLYSKIPHTELWILGEVDKEHKDLRIRYFGEIPSRKASGFYNNVDFLIHLAYDDNCPNSVVEALVSGLPVICTSNGGTKELVKNSGEVIQEGRYKFEPFYSWDIPKVDKRSVKKHLERCIQNQGTYEFPREDLFISNCAKKYIEAFEQTLDM